MDIKATKSLFPTFQVVSCPDYQKMVTKFAVSIFVVIHVLGSSNCSDSLREKYFADSELTEIFEEAGKHVDVAYSQEKSIRPKKKDFSDILKTHKDFNELQTWTLHIKQLRCAKCTSPNCKKQINRGDECLQVNGALTVPYSSNKPVQQKFYFCVCFPLFSMDKHFITKFFLLRKCER